MHVASSKTLHEPLSFAAVSMEKKLQIVPQVLQRSYLEQLVILQLKETEGI